MGINSYAGRLLVFWGYFIFIAVVGAVILALISAQKEYKRGITRMNPLGCTAGAFIVLLSAALIRSCAQTAVNG